MKYFWEEGIREGYPDARGKVILVKSNKTLHISQKVILVSSWQVQKCAESNHGNKIELSALQFEISEWLALYP
jgi:hypothetical protein